MATTQHVQHEPVLRRTLFTVIALWKREVIKFVRDRSRLFGALAQPLGFWILLGLGFHATFQMPASAALDISYLEFLFPGIIALMILFTSIFSTISVVEERASGLLQAALVAPTPRSALVLGNALGGTSLALVQTVILLLILPFLGLSYSLAGILLVLLAGLLLGLAFTGLGFTIAWHMETTRGFHAVMNLFLLPLWFLSGAVFPVEGASPLLSWIIYINPVSYAIDLIRHGLYWPGAPPLELAPVTLSVGISLVLAAVLLAVAVYAVRRPLFNGS